MLYKNPTMTTFTIIVLTGKCKEDFKRWFYHNHLGVAYRILEHNVLHTDIFKNLTPSMQYGVYVDFFDSVGIYIDLQIHSEPTMSGLIFKSIRPNILDNRRFYNVGASFGERDRARTEAIKKSNEIYNSK